LGLLSKVYINSSKIGRHGGGVIDEFYTRLFENGVPHGPPALRTLTLQGIAVLLCNMKLYPFT